MVYKPRKGTFEIDRVMRGLGRVRLRTGTHDRRRAQQYELMLEDLPLETVRLIMAGQLDLREAYDLWSRGETRALPTAATLRPLLESLQDWERTHAPDVGADEAKNRAKVLRYLTQAAPAARVHELPTLLTAMRTEHRSRQSAFNHARTICMAFARDVLGSRSALHNALAEVPKLKTPRKLGRHPCTVQEAKAITAALPTKWAPVWWAMCCTGMGPREYFTNGWTVTRDGIEIHGTKRVARARIVPFIVAPPKPPGTDDGFESALSRAGVGVAPYDGRRTFARWLQELRLPSYRQNAYMGHGPKDMRELYPWGDIREWLAEDGKALREYVGEPVQLRVRA